MTALLAYGDFATLKAMAREGYVQAPLLPVGTLYQHRTLERAGHLATLFFLREDRPLTEERIEQVTPFVERASHQLARARGIWTDAPCDVLPVPVGAEDNVVAFFTLIPVRVH